jgi:hypothetical protein
VLFFFFVANAIVFSRVFRGHKYFYQRFNDFCMYITDKQNKGLFVFDTVFTIIWITLSGSPDTGPDKESIENALYSMIYIQKSLKRW